jgi:AcrR family transcriptional regulator
VKSSEPKSPRIRQLEATRASILDAALAMLRDEPFEHFSHEAAAQRAGVAARTAYRHFPTRADLVRALWERLRDETGTHWPSTEAEILPATRAQFATFEAHSALVRASIVAAASTNYPAHGSTEGRAAFRKSLADITAGLPPDEADRLVAVCVAIYSAPFWQMLRDRGQLSNEQAAEAAAWALGALLDAARGRARGLPERPTPAPTSKRPGP